MPSNSEKLAVLSQVGDLLLSYAHLSKDYERFPHNYGLKEAFGIEINLNHMEMHMLAVIQKQPGISAQELSVIFNRTKGAVSQVIKVLAREGLIIKRENPNNARINNLYATEIGLVACRNHELHEEEFYSRLMTRFEHFSVQDLERVLEALSIISEYLKRKTPDHGEKTTSR